MSLRTAGLRTAGVTEARERAVRYLTAYRSARARAACHLDTIGQLDDLCSYLNEQLRDEEQESRRLRMAWTSARRRAARLAAELAGRGLVR